MRYSRATLDELAVFCIILHPRVNFRHKARFFFKMMDMDGDDALSRQDLYKFFRQHAKNRTRWLQKMSFIEHNFGIFDSDLDGLIDFEDFYSLLNLEVKTVIYEELTVELASPEDQESD